MLAQKCMYLYIVIIIKYIIKYNIFLGKIYIFIFYSYRELLDHVRLHGEELAVVHQQTMDYNFSTKSKVHRALSNESSKLKFFYIIDYKYN